VTDDGSGLERLLGVLELERLDRDLFRGWNPAVPGNHRQALFGGQVAAHALRAAIQTVDVDHRPHSLHGYFLRPGRDGAHTVLRVDRIRDGRSFTTRTVVALQEGEAIFSLTASFHKQEPGGEFQVSRAPDVPTPDELITAGQRPRDMWGHNSPFERLEVPEEVLGDAPRRVMWVRTRGPLPEDPVVHACVLTFISDMGPLGAVRRALGAFDRHGMGASLDHSIWFHRPPRVDGWMLYDVSSWSNSGARGLATGTLHTADGLHLASIAQEALVRLGPPA
jgi:acyl-CoA thioesterase-2